MSSQTTLILDGHLDLAYNALFHRRDLTQDINELREREDPRPPGPSHPDSLRERKRQESPAKGTATVSLSEMRRGHVGIALSTIMSRVQMPTGTLDDGARTQLAAHALGQAHLHYYKALERAGHLRFIRSAEDLDARLLDWSNPSLETPLGLILSMESADPILGPDQVGWWHDQGLRSVGLTHFGANTWGHGTGTQGGLYACAYPLLDALAETNIALDLTHAADLTFWQLLDYWQGPVHASHCMCRALVPGQRHLSDDMIKALIDRGGVIGIVFAEFMLNPEVDFDDPSTYPRTARRSMSAAIDHIDHMAQLSGDVDHVGIGSDLDGGYGTEQCPMDVQSIADLQLLETLLKERGYSHTQCEQIFHHSFLRVLRLALG